MKRLLLAAVIVASLTGCAATDIAAPKRQASNKVQKDFECASGYLVAYDENGNPYCVPDSH